MKQVEKRHYDFAAYESPERFTSYYHQLQATLRLAPGSLVEIGVGSGLFVQMARKLGIDAFGLDVDPELQPAVCGNLLQLPLQDSSVDVCAAFQILEHLPFEDFRPAVRELARVCRTGIVLSLPEFGNAAMVLSLPFVRKLRFAGRALPLIKPLHHFDGQHYWEINKRGYGLARVIAAIERAGLECEDTWLNSFNPYHRFFVLRKTGATVSTGARS